MIYTEMTAEDKAALHSGNCAIRTKIIVSPGTDEEVVLTETNSVKSWEYVEDRYVPDKGFIGEFVARELTGELHNISDDFSIENKTIELQLAILRTELDWQFLTTESGIFIITEDGEQLFVDKTTNIIETWYSLGTFIIMEPEDDEVKDNTKFDAMDITTRFNVDFNASYTNDTFTTSFIDTLKAGGSFTAIDLARYVCAQARVEFGNEVFTHSDFIINTNQFTEGNSCRDVMKSIAQLAYGWCSIGWDDKCYINEIEVDTSNVGETETITNDQYYSLSTQKLNYGPINRVVVGPEDIIGEEAVSEDETSIEAIGVNELDIYDNPITYTKPLREQAILGAERLFGLEYSPLEVETIGHPWLKANKPITVVNMEGVERHTYPLSLTISYSGHIKTTIVVSEPTKNEKQQSYNKTIYKDVRNMKVEVDRQAGVITILNSKTTALEDGLGKLETKVEQSVTDTYSKTEIKEIVTGVGADGVVVTSVKSAAGTFDMNGLTIEQSEAKTKTNINADGMVIYNKQETSDKSLLTVNSLGVTAENITVKTYLNTGEYSRFEDYKHTNGKVGTGAFWMGSD